MIVVLSQTLELPEDTPEDYLRVLSAGVAAHVGIAIHQDLGVGGIETPARVRMVTAGYVQHPMSHLVNYETGERL